MVIEFLFKYFFCAWGLCDQYACVNTCWIRREALFFHIVMRKLFSRKLMNPLLLYYHIFHLIITQIWCWIFHHCMDAVQHSSSLISMRKACFLPSSITGMTSPQPTIMSSAILKNELCETTNQSITLGSQGFSQAIDCQFIANTLLQKSICLLCPMVF